MIGMLIGQALRSLVASPVRTFLTILGVIIGISSVVMFMALGEGLRKDINSEIAGLGSNLLIIVPGKFTSAQQASPNLISGDILKQEDVQAISTLPNVEKVSPMMLVGGVLRNGDKNDPSSILIGAGASFNEIFSTISIGQGRFFTSTENLNKARVIVLGQGAATTLFGSPEEALGKNVLLGKEPLEVIGVTKVPEQASLLGGSDYSALSVMPIETAGSLTGGVKIMRILTKLNPNVEIKSQIEPVKEALLIRHSEDDFTVLTQEDILNLLDSVLKMLTSAIIAIAAISLVVAGVGIMNIMLVSVTERTREIGLRKALGAPNWAILLQFLIEAIVLTMAGAVIALGLSLLSSTLISRYAPLHPVVTLSAVGLAVGVAVIVGIIFGLAPAIRAAKLDPIQALRYE